MTALKDLRVLVTGVTGQVGFELIGSLNSCGAEIILAARDPRGLSVLGYPIAALDLSNPQETRALIKNLKPNLVINPAAYTAVDKAESESELAYRVNSESVSVIAETMKKLNGAVIHFSTDYVYNPLHNNSVKESDQCNPVNVYAASKKAGEEALESSGVTFVNLRTSWVYGRYGNNFVKTMLRLGKDREVLRVVADQIGSPTSALTLANFVNHLLNREPNRALSYLKDVQGTYNISDLGYTNWHAFACEIFAVAKELGVELKVNQVEAIKTSEYPTPATRPLNSQMSMRKLNEQFDYFPATWQRNLRNFLYQSRLNS